MVSHVGGVYENLKRKTNKKHSSSADVTWAESGRWLGKLANDGQMAVSIV